MLLSFLPIKAFFSTEINNGLLVNGNCENIEPYNTYLQGIVTCMKYVILAEEKNNMEEILKQVKLGSKHATIA